MKVTIRGKRYDSTKCEKLGYYNHHNYANNYSGCTELLRASDGVLLLETKSNGQDCYLSDNLCEFTGEIEKFDFTDEQERRCAELELIKIVD